MHREACSKAADVWTTPEMLPTCPFLHKCLFPCCQGQGDLAVPSEAFWNSTFSNHISFERNGSRKIGTTLGTHTPSEKQNISGEVRPPPEAHPPLIFFL